MQKKNDIPSPFAAGIRKPRRIRRGVSAVILAMTSVGLGCSQAHMDSMRGPRIAASTHMASAGMLERQNNNDAAMKQYEEAIQSDPKMAKAYFGLSRLHFKLKRYEDAAAVLIQGVAAKCDTPSIQNNLGVAYLQQEKFTEAEHCFRRALEVSPRFVRARMNLAIALARQDRVNESLDQFSEVVPRDDAFFNIAVIRAAADDYAGATKALKDALAYNPGYQPALDHLDRIVRIARAEEDAKAAVARLASRNALARFSEPVASNTSANPSECAIPDGGLTEVRSASAVLSSNFETRTVAEAEAGRVGQSSDQLNSQDSQSAAEPVEPAEPAKAPEQTANTIPTTDAPRTGTIVRYDVPCAESESGGAIVPLNIEEPMDAIEVSDAADPCGPESGEMTPASEPGATKVAESPARPSGKKSSSKKSSTHTSNVILPTYTAPATDGRQAIDENE